MEFHLFDLWFYNSEKCYQFSLLSFMSSEYEYFKSFFHIGYHGDCGFTMQIFFRDIF